MVPRLVIVMHLYCSIRKWLCPAELCKEIEISAPFRPLEPEALLSSSNTKV